MKSKLLCFIISIVIVLSLLTGCATQTVIQTNTLLYETFEEYVANSIHLHPEKDDNLRYAVYDNFAQVIECVSDEANIVIPDTYNGVPVIGIKASTFANNQTIKHLTIGKNVLQIGQYAFQNCTSLTQVKMSNSVNDIQAYAFSGCSALTSIVVPPKVNTLYSGTFSGCTSLAKVVIESAEMATATDARGNAITTAPARVIQSGVFSNCDSLAIMWIPEDIATVTDSILGGTTPKPLICGGDATASSWFATLQNLDYEIVDRDDFNTKARLYQKSITGSKTDVGSYISSGVFDIELTDVAYYNKLGSLTAGDNHVLVAATFRIYNTTMISQYFDGLNISCTSTAPGKDGMTSSFEKYPLMLSTSVLNMSYPVGNINPDSYIEGVIILRVTDRYDNVNIQFDGASAAFVI